MLALSESRCLMEESWDKWQREGEQKYIFALYFSKVENVFIKVYFDVVTQSLCGRAGAESTISMVKTLKLLRVKWSVQGHCSLDSFQVSYSLYLLNAALGFFPLVHFNISILGLLSVVPELAFGKSRLSLKCFTRSSDGEKRRNLKALLWW